MKYEMLGARLLVKVLKSGDRTTGGLWIPEMATDGTPWLKAEVLAVGTGRITPYGQLVPLQVAVGDTILFFRTSVGGEQLVVPLEDGTEGLCINEPNVLAILRDLDKVTSITSVSGAPMVLQ